MDENGAIVSKDGYYPFGMQMPGMSYASGDPYAKMKFSSRELDQEAGLNKYHYGFREYDPELGRWNRPDPMYYTDPGVSPYAFVGNDPLNRYDVQGLLDDSKLKLLPVPDLHNGYNWNDDWNGDFNSSWDSFFAPSNGVLPYYTGSSSSFLATHPSYKKGKAKLKPRRVAVYDYYERVKLTLLEVDGHPTNITWYQDYYENLRWEVRWVVAENVSGWDAIQKWIADDPEIQQRRKMIRNIAQLMTKLIAVALPATSIVNSTLHSIKTSRALFKKKTLGVGSKLFGRHAISRVEGLTNSNDYLRVGWGWNNETGGTHVFRISIGNEETTLFNIKFPIHRDIYHVFIP